MFPYFDFDQFSEYCTLRRSLLDMKTTPFAFTIVVLALLFSFGEQGNDGEEIFLFLFSSNNFDVSHFV